jgi:hypothetical protein
VAGISEVSRAVSCAGSMKRLTATNQEVAGSSPAGPANICPLKNLATALNLNECLVRVGTAGRFRGATSNLLGPPPRAGFPNYSADCVFPGNSDQVGVLIDDVRAPIRSSIAPHSSSKPDERRQRRILGLGGICAGRAGCRSRAPESVESE